MLASDFDYNLPPEFIAQTPAEPRDSSRLMVVDRKKRMVEGRHFYNILEYLKPGDLLVWNNTKVFKARLRGSIMLDEDADGIEKKIDSTDRILNMPAVEIFLLRPMENNKVWRVLAKPGRKLRLGMKIVFAQDFSAEVMMKETDGTFLVQFGEDDVSVRAKANKYGEVPSPPYIKYPTPYPLPCRQAGSPKRGGTKGGVDLANDYQTVYAKYEGSVAAPTAGFHFTPELIEKLKQKGICFAEVTLHVGLGTFQPVKTKKIEDHKMHSEWAELTAKNADLINQAKAEGRRVIAVGTTTVRTLEGVVQLANNLTIQQFDNLVGRNKEIKKQGNIEVKPYAGEINLFIIPGFKFKIIDALITNFHLPKSTLLMLVCAFTGDTKFVLDCYKKAIKEQYRFYSFGDAMLIF